MKLTHKIVGLTAAAAIVAATGLVAAPAATSATPAKKATGTTLISFDKKYAAIVAGIVAVAPAKKNKTNLTFPIVDVNKSVITHTGGISIGGATVSDPVITIKGKTKTATVVFTALGTPLELFTVKHLKTTQSAKTTVHQGDLHLTANADTVALLNSLLPQPVFTADMGLGQIRITVNK